MTTPEQPGTPALTRKQMRELRNTGTTPVISEDAAPEPAHEPEPEPATTAEPAPEPEPASEPAHEDAPENAPEAEPVPIVVPLARAADPIVVPDPPVPDAAVNLGVAPLTRRQARQQERIRTASVPVITPEVAAAHTAAHASDAPGPAAPDEPVEAEMVDDEVIDDEAQPDAVSEVFPPLVKQPEPEAAASDRAVVSPLFGAGLLEGDAAHVELPPSFDQLLARSSSGAGGTPNALIVSQGPSASPIVAPVTATGEVLITGTLNLPEGLGSNGHAPGVADGREADAVLIDGELPAHSSPTPIAASAAISTVKNSGEIIKPPAPEKGSKLMMTLAITAGVLALALVGVLILAFVTGAL